MNPLDWLPRRKRTAGEAASRTGVQILRFCYTPPQLVEETQQDHYMERVLLHVHCFHRKTLPIRLSVEMPYLE
jgi:hypothetical protein